MIDTASLRSLLPAFLARQPWYRGSPPNKVEVAASDVWVPGSRGVVSLLVDADGARYHVIVALHPGHDRLDGVPYEAVLGEVSTDDGPALAFEATAQRDAALMLLEVATDGARRAKWARPTGAEGSTTSLVYDDELVLKVFRRLHPGRNPEVEVVEALAASGFRRVARPIVTWAHEGYDLGVVHAYLSGGADGWALAATSLRDLRGVHDSQSVPVVEGGSTSPADPALAGGDFSAEARRLGTVTAELHRSLAKAFGSEPGDAGAWASEVDAELAASGTYDGPAASAATDTMRAVADAGPATRIHGDYHLRRVLRTDSGWFVVGFEGQPWRPLEDRRRPSSPLRDVAGMVHSLHQAAQSASRDGEADQDLVKAWEVRNRQAFLDGYLPRAEKAGVVPADARSVEALLAGFELAAAASATDTATAPPPQGSTAATR